MPVKAVFLDRDGTLIEHVPYLASPDGVVLLPGVRDALAAMLSQGVKLFLFTNQSGVGRGFFTLRDVERVNQRMLELLALPGVVFTDICIAPERPGEPSKYRKPSPRFILETLSLHGIAREEAWMIGDSPSDWMAGLAAGVNVVAILATAAASEKRNIVSRAALPSYSGVEAWFNDYFHH